MPATAAARYVLRQASPLLVLVGLSAVASLVVLLCADRPHLLLVTAWMAKLAVFGLVGSFAVHETMHLLLLKRVTTVTHISLDVRRSRISLQPTGQIGPGQAIAVAVAGPGACVLVGVCLWWVDRAVSVLFLLHFLHLLPLFGDGRTIWRAMSAHRSARRATGHVGHLARAHEGLETASTGRAATSGHQGRRSPWSG